MKKIFAASMGLVLALSGCFAQGTAPENTVIEGERGRALIFNRAGGLSDIRLSRNQKYVMMSYVDAGDDVDESTAISMVYDIANDSWRTYEGAGMAEYVDSNNYVTNWYIVRNGQRIEAQGGIERASADLSVLAASGYDETGHYRTFLIDGETGEIFDTLPRHWDVPEVTGGGYVSSALDMSDDGTVFVGRSSANFGGMNFSPVFWDVANDTSFFVGTETPPYINGSLYGTNNDGTLICGDNGDDVVIAAYDKENRSVEIRRIQAALGYSVCYAFAVSENDWILGIDQVSAADVYSRVPFMYNYNTGNRFTLHEYLTDLYGLDFESTMPLFSAGSISDDARIIAGYSYQNAGWIPYVIILDETQLHPRLRHVVVNQVRGVADVEISWYAPIDGQYTLAGYNIYRDSVKINGDTPIPVEETSYTDALVSSGVHAYSIEAVYTDNEVSAQTEPASLLVITGDGCLPVQEINSDIIYNRTVNLSWGLPSAVMSNPQNASKSGIDRDESSIMEHTAPKGKIPVAKAYQSDTLDYVSSFNTQSIYASAAVQIDDYLYIGQFMSNEIQVYDANTGVLLQEVAVDGLPGMWDMEYHDGVFYCINNNNTVYQIRRNDVFDLRMSNSFTTMVSELAHIAYIEDTPYGDLLMTGDIHNIVFYPLNPIDAQDTVGIATDFDIDGMIICGSAYHKGRLYLADQGGESQCDVVVLDWNTGKRLAVNDMGAYPAVDEFAAVSDGYRMVASGITVDTLEDGTALLRMIVQPLIIQNHIVTLEAASASDLVGYNVYRDGELITSSPLEKRRFTDVIYEPGTYTYTVEVVKADGCTATSDMVNVSEDVTIYPIGECLPPTDVEAYESNEQVCLSWNLEAGDGFVGFNIYRNDELIAEHLLDLKYNDPGVEKDQAYTYRVESFYNNSCVASDSVEIEVTFEGTAQAPSLVNVEAEANQDGTFTTTTTWDLPYFEEPMAMGYCNQPMGSINLSGTSTLYGMIGWDTSSMDLFEDLYLVGVEFIIGDEVTNLNGIVVIDNQIVHSEQLTDRLRVGEWQRMFFNQAFPMQQQQEIAVGFAASFNPETIQYGVIVYDMGPGDPWFGDIISPDGTSWYSLADVAEQSGLAIDANLCINALVVRKRDLDNAAKSINPMAYIQKVAASASDVRLGQPTAIKNGAKTTSESFSLKGFNVYRDNEQLNDELLTSFSFEEANVALGAYDYSVGAVYAHDTVISEPFYIDLADLANENEEGTASIHTYPNPVDDMLNIRGEYRSLSIVDLSGRVVMTGLKDMQSVPLESLNAGIYFLQFELENGQAYIVKIVKR